MALEYAPLGDIIAAWIYAAIVGTYITLSMVFKSLYYGPRTYFGKKPRPLRPKLLTDPKLGIHNFARLKQSTMHYVTKGSKDKPTVIFLHGFPDFWYTWHNQMAALCDDYYVIAPELRGYGETSKPKAVEEYTIDKLIAEIKELLDYLNIKRVTMVGHDWGGGLAWSFAMQYPDTVDKLVVLNAPHLYAYFELSKTSMRQICKAWYQAVNLIPFFGELYLGLNDCQFVQDVLTAKGWGAKPGTFSEEELEAYKYVFKTYDDRVGMANYDRAIVWYKYPIPATNYVRCPTLIIWGTSDAYLEIELAEMSRPYVKNECTIKLLEGISHWVQNEAPQEVNQYMRQFLEGKLK